MELLDLSQFVKLGAKFKVLIFLDGGLRRVLKRSFILSLIVVLLFPMFFTVREVNATTTLPKTYYGFVFASNDDLYVANYSYESTNDNPIQNSATKYLKVNNYQNGTDTNIVNTKGFVDIAFDSIGTMYATDNYNIFKVEDGIAIAISKFPSDNWDPTGIAFDKDDNMYVSFQRDKKIIKYTSQVVLNATINNITETTSTIPFLAPSYNPLGLTIFADNLYFVDYNGDISRVEINDSNKEITILKNVVNAYDVAVDSKGTLYWNDYNNGTIYSNEIVATPVASPASGAVASGSTVSLSSFTPGTTIYYTTDGSTPSTSASKTQYTGPITVNADMRIKAMAVKSGLPDSPVMSATYTVISAIQNSTISPATASFDKKRSNQTDVTTTLTLNGNSFLYIENGGVRLTPLDYSVDGTAVTISKEYLATLPLGPATLTFYFSAGATQDFIINITKTNTPPVAIDDIKSIVVNGILNDRITATDEDSDLLSYVKTTDASNGAVLLNTDGSYTYMPFANFIGTDSFEVEVRDGQFGGVDTATITINVGLGAPIGLVGIASTSVSGTDGKITGLSTSLDYEYRLLPNIQWTSVTNASEITNLAEGNYEVRVKASESTPASSAATVSVPAYIPPADAPTVTTSSTDEDTLSSVLEITPTQAGGATTTHYKITDITGGQLFHKNGATPVAEGTYITASEGGEGLRFKPSANQYGLNGFGFKVQAATSVTDTVKLSEVVTVSITVNEVNDPPVAVDNNSLPPIEEDSGERRIPTSQLLANDSAGPNEGGQTLQIKSISNEVGGMVRIEGSDVVFTPNPNFSGQAGFDYIIEDNGTTRGVPDSLTDTARVSFNINPQADAPSVTHSVTEEDTLSSNELVISRNEVDPRLHILKSAASQAEHSTKMMGLLLL